MTMSIDGSDGIDMGSRSGNGGGSIGGDGSGNGGVIYILGCYGNGNVETVMEMVIVVTAVMALVVVTAVMVLVVVIAMVVKGGGVI